MRTFIQGVASAAVMVAATVFVAPSASAQVVVSEVNFPDATGADQWVELLNLGSAPVDLSDWSIYHTTNAPSAPYFCTGAGGGAATARCFWWGFWPGTTIAPGAYLKVNWMAPVIPPPPAGEINTGSTQFHFLFGLGGESLAASSGALAVLNTRESSLMASSAYIQDWVCWGSAGLPREGLAVAAGRWTQGDVIPAPIDDDSLALDYSLNAEPTLSSAFFHDASPTPSRHNHPGAVVTTTFGQACHVGTVLGDPVLTARSTPTHGNRAFDLEVSGTNAGFLFLLLGSPVPQPGISLSQYGFGPCRQWVMPNPGLWCYQFPRQPGTTSLLPLFRPQPGPTVRGGPFSMQAVTFFGFADFGFSQGITLTVGR